MKKNIKRVGIFTYDFYPIEGGQGKHVYEIYKQNQKQKDFEILIFSPRNNNLKNHIQIFPETTYTLPKRSFYDDALSDAQYTLSHQADEILNMKTLHTRFATQTALCSTCFHLSIWMSPLLRPA